jgi:hypothetical protein
MKAARLVLVREALFGEKTELNTVRSRYRKMFKRYAFFSWIGPWSRIAPHMGEPVHDGIDKHSADLRSPGYNEFDAILDLASLADRSLFDRLRRCSCGGWLFARFSHQRFCRWAQNWAQGENGRSCIAANLLVRKGGLEPPRFYPPDPKSGASANSATFALSGFLVYLLFWEQGRSHPLQAYSH